MATVGALTLLCCLSAVIQGARLLACTATREADKHVAAVTLVLCGLYLIHHALLLVAPEAPVPELRGWVPLSLALLATVACWRASRRNRDA